jgi:alpha-tubulin suppressor-like RCC1 family protein
MTAKPSVNIIAYTILNTTMGIINQSKYTKQLSAILGMGHGAMVCSFIVNSKAYTGGRNEYGQLCANFVTGLGTVNAIQYINAPNATTILAGKTISYISSNATTTFVIDSDGNLYACGNNGNGQLGNKTSVSVTAPINITTITGSSLYGRSISQVEINSLPTTVALDSTGNVHTWGYAPNGPGANLGYNSSTNGSNTPVNISTYGSLNSKTITMIASGSHHSVALDSTGQVHAWGHLGNDDYRVAINLSTGTQAGSISGCTIIQIRAAAGVTLALDTIGRVHFCGHNGAFSLVLGSWTSAASIACGTSHRIVLDTNGAVHAWGSNSAGQCGNGTLTNITTPVNISTISPILSTKYISSITCGDQQTYAVDNMGYVYAWGLNTNGELCDGTLTNRTSPIQTTFVPN